MFRYGLVLGLVSLALGQYGGPGGPGGPPPHGAWGGANRPSGYPKQPQSPMGRPQSPFSALASVLPGSGSSGVNAPPSYDDPIPQIPHDSTYDTQSLPAKLPILAPNGVVEIYNRVVDDLIKRLEADFAKKKMDPMPVLIRSTPAGPVRVPGYLQRRPFRRPGAALYRNGPGFDGPPYLPPPHFPPHPSQGSHNKKKKMQRSNPLPTESRFPEGGRPAVGASDEDSKSSNGGRGVVKISAEDAAVPETTPLALESVEAKNVTEEASSEEDAHFIRARSEEYFPEEDEDEEETRSSHLPMTKTKTKKTKKADTVDEDDDEEEKAKDDVEVLLERYSSKNTKAKTKGSSSSSSSSKNNKSKEKTSDKGSSKTVVKSAESEDDDDDDDMEVRDDLDDDADVSFDAEPGTGGGGRPQGGYYPPGGPPALPSKPNAVLTGLSKIRRASDVAVSVDARSAMITSRLLVGPINIYINESSEPKERNLKATIPELEAEIILMERHGVVFLQRFTLDRAYGQDVEISIPKSKGGSSKNKKNGPRPGQPGFDPNSPAAEDRYRTKMAAHISMEVVKVLRSGNLRVNLMRTAQSSMSKLKLPIVKPKKKKAKKEQRKQQVEEE